MICPNCKNMLPNNATVCNKCGMTFNVSYNQQYNAQQYNNQQYNAQQNNQQYNNQQYNSQQNNNQQYNNQQYNSPYNNNQYGNINLQQQPVKAGSSGLGIAALILSILGCTFIIGAVLAFIDIFKNDGKNKTVSKVALGICGAWIVIGLLGGSGIKNHNRDVSVEKTTEMASEEKSNNTTTIESITEESTTEESTNEEVNESGPEKINVGDEFENKTIRGMVTYVDLDFKGYNNDLTPVESGKKAILVKIRLNNISEKSNYVSVGDFDCYVDNISTNAEIMSGLDISYNANIQPGRSAILGAMYIIPEDSKSIELEYRPIGESAKRKIIVISDDSTTDTIIDIDKSESNDVTVSKDVKVIGPGEEFGNKTITGVVLDVNLDYKEYNNVWTEIPEGNKAIYVKIQVTNQSDETNYVSVSDFDCYVDNTLVSAELVSGSDDDYNANIESGRSAILGAMYVIPEDTESIELEYVPLGESSDRVIIKLQ